MTISIEDAYATCEAITGSQAKNFAYGIRLLRPPERRALSAVYALARRIDDIGDGNDDDRVKLAGLEEVRVALSAASPTVGDPVMTAVFDARERYDLPMRSFADLIDGCVMDVRGAYFETIEDLIVYCRAVAGSIGRLSLSIFGGTQQSVGQIADDLGVALQLTNIVRDVREDYERGRVYLPAVDLARFECPPAMLTSPERLAKVIALECERAKEWFAIGRELLPHLDRRGRACVGAMAGIYYRLLDQIAADPISVTRTRVSVPTTRKIGVALLAISGLPAWSK